jgi:hypothetical protein
LPRATPLTVDETFASGGPLTVRVRVKDSERAIVAEAGTTDTVTSLTIETVAAAVTAPDVA